MAAHGFVHSPLSQERSIRVLELLPSRDINNPVSCLVKERNLDDRLKYEALSYVWGARVPGHFVFVEDKILPVTPNCLEALKHLRLKFKRRVLWIDAICIDQTEGDDGTRERNHQIQLMGTIYSRAKRVIVWLGVSEPTTRRTLRRLKMIDWIPGRMWKVRHRLVETIVDVKSQEYHSAFIRSIIRNDWWHRAWTFQEQVMARRCTVLQGRHSIPIQTLMDFATLAGFASTYHESPFSSTLSLVRWACIAHKSTRRWSARPFLSCASLLGATEPADQIYALYSVLVMRGLSLPKPDYHKPLELIYEEAIWAYIESQQDLSILQLAARPTYVQGLPSWVPAYHLENGGHGVAPSVVQPKEYDPQRTYDYFLLETFDYFRRTKNPYTSHAGAEHSPKTLRVAGRYIGKAVFSKGEDRFGEDHRLMVCWDWCRCVHESNGGQTPSPGYNDALLELYKAMTLKLWELPKMTPRSRHEYGFYVFDRWFHAMISTTRPEELQLMADDYFNLSPNRGFLLNQMDKEYSDTYQKALVVLDNGMMGLAPYWCEVGDEVYLLRGADRPLVLRRDGESYRLVGIVHIHSLYEAQPWTFDGDDLRDVLLI